MAGAEQSSEKLVTVRALESTLELSADEAGTGNASRRLGTATRGSPDATASTNSTIAAGDQRGTPADQREDRPRRSVRGSSVSTSTCCRGYETVTVLVGEGPRRGRGGRRRVRGYSAFETFTGDIVAFVAAPTADADEDPIDDGLVGVDFTRYEVPDTERSPDDYVDELETRKRELESRIDEIDAGVRTRSGRKPHSLPRRGGTDRRGPAIRSAAAVRDNRTRVRRGGLGSTDEYERPRQPR